jgi:hypothetical protein
MLQRSKKSVRTMRCAYRNKLLSIKMTTCVIALSFVQDGTDFFSAVCFATQAWVFYSRRIRRAELKSEDAVARLMVTSWRSHFAHQYVKSCAGHGDCISQFFKKSG